MTKQTQSVDPIAMKESVYNLYIIVKFSLTNKLRWSLTHANNVRIHVELCIVSIPF